MQGELILTHSIDDWDIAIEPQGTFGIRVNESKGLKVYTQPEDIRANCDLIVYSNCKG